MTVLLTVLLTVLQFRLGYDNDIWKNDFLFAINNVRIISNVKYLLKCIILQYIRWISQICDANFDANTCCFVLQLQ